MLIVGAIVIGTAVLLMIPVCALAMKWMDDEDE